MGWWMVGGEFISICMSSILNKKKAGVHFAEPNYGRTLS